MLKYLAGILVKEIVQALSKAVSDFLKLQKKRKEDKKQVDDALKEKDPANRARRIDDLLS